MAFNRRKIDLLSPSVLFPILYAGFFVAGSINFYQPPRYITSDLFNPIPSWMYGLYLCGLVGYFSGLFAFHLLPKNGAAARARYFNTDLFQRVVLAVAIVSVLSWIVTVALWGVPILHPDTANETRLTHRGVIFQVFMHLAWTAMIIAPVLVWVRGGKRKWDWISTVGSPLLFSALMLSMGGRGSAVDGLISIGIARYYLKKTSRLKMALAVAIAFAAFSALGYLRNQLAVWSATDTETMSTVEALGIPAPVAPFIDMAVDSRYSVATLRDLTEIVPADFPFTHGKMTLLPLTAFLPGHQDMADVVFKNMLGMEFQGSGTPATILGPLYVDFGWAGVFFGMSGYGFLLAWLYWKMKHRPGISNLLYYAWWLQCCLMAIFDGLDAIFVLLVPIFWSILFAIARMRYASYGTWRIPVLPVAGNLASNSRRD